MIEGVNVEQQGAESAGKFKKVHGVAKMPLVSLTKTEDEIGDVVLAMGSDGSAHGLLLHEMNAVVAQMRHSGLGLVVKGDILSGVYCFYPECGFKKELLALLEILTQGMKILSVVEAGGENTMVSFAL